MKLSLSRIQNLSNPVSSYVSDKMAFSIIFSFKIFFEKIENIFYSDDREK